MRKKRDPRLSLEQTRRITRARVLGRGSGRSVFLEDHCLARIIAIIERDVARRPVLNMMPDLARGTKPFFGMDVQEFEEPIEVPDFNGLYIEACEKISEFETMFECLCELHKRRAKIQIIKSTQPMPDISQIGARALLEYGSMPSAALASIMVWRKFLYDLDNRIAQETGYLFEPLVAKALGGEAYDAQSSPIRRRDDASRGRQVDCIEDRNAYEIKMRISDAASGRGRIGEEMSFPSDCVASGYIPILLAFQSDNSHKVRDLVAKYEDLGGHAYIGKDAWDFLGEAAGETMMGFIEDYLLQIIGDVVEAHDPENLMQMSLKSEQDFLEINAKDNKGQIFREVIPRCE